MSLSMKGIIRLLVVTILSMITFVSCVTNSTNAKIKAESFDYVKRHNDCFILLVNEYFSNDTLTLSCQDNLIFKDSVVDTEKRKDEMFNHPFPQFGMTITFHKSGSLAKMITLSLGGNEKYPSILSQETKNLSYKRKRLINGNLFKISTVLNGFEQEFYVDVQNVKMVILSRDIGKDTLNCDTIKYRIKYLE